MLATVDAAPGHAIVSPPRPVRVRQRSKASRDSPTGDEISLPLRTSRDARLQMAVRSACASEILVFMQGLENPERDLNRQGVRTPCRPEVVTPVGERPSEGVSDGGNSLDGLVNCPGIESSRTYGAVIEVSLDLLNRDSC